MNAVTFGVYSYIMKRYGSSEYDADLDTLENLVERLGLNKGWEKTVEKPEKPYYLNSNQSQQIIEFKDYILLKEKYLIYYLYKYFYGQLE